MNFGNVLSEKRQILYESKTSAVEQTLWKEPDGKVHLQILYKNFAKPVLKDLPCEYLGDGKYKCKNVIIDTKQNKTLVKITVPDALKESPVLNEIGSFIKSSVIKTIIVGVITGVAVYTLTKFIDKTLNEVIYD
ncbi:hypothetical protein [Persephonella sp.]